MTRARRIHEGERTQAEIVHDPDNPVIADTEPKLGEPRLQPDRMCKSCEKATDADTAYGVVIATSGLGHYTADANLTLCGREVGDDWETA